MKGGGPVDELPSTSIQITFEYSFDTVRAFLTGLVVIKDGNGEELFPNSAELELGETSFSSAEEASDDRWEDISLVLEDARVSNSLLLLFSEYEDVILADNMSSISISDPSFDDNEHSVLLEEEWLALPIDTGT